MTSRFAVVACLLAVLLAAALYFAFESRAPKTDGQQGMSTAQFLEVFGSAVDRASELPGIELEWPFPGGSRSVTGIVMPMFDGDGSVALALSLVGFRAELTSDEVQQYGLRLKESGLRVTRATRGRTGD